MCARCHYVYADTSLLSVVVNTPFCSLTHCLSASQAMSIPLFALCPEWATFLWLNSPPLRTASPTPHIANDPDKSGERCSRESQNPRCSILTFTAAI